MTDHPTPSPAPASGAETPCLACLAEMDQLANDPDFDGKSGDVEWVCDHRPTPPSDAGTSERETGEATCAICDHPKSAHVDYDRHCRACCVPANGMCQHVFKAAAPAAEGPRGMGVKEALAVVGDGIFALTAALPGAEAGTPEDADVQSIADYLDASCLGHAGCTIPHAALDRIRARLASPSPTGAPAEQQKN